MEFLITLAVGALLVALGVLLIHRLNAARDARIAAHHLSDRFPALRRPPGRSRPGPAGRTAAHGHPILTPDHSSARRAAGWGDPASRRTPPADLSLRSEGNTPSCAPF